MKNSVETGNFSILGSAPFAHVSKDGREDRQLELSALRRSLR
jgi:hypothetical protein